MNSNTRFQLQRGIESIGYLFFCALLPIVIFIGILVTIISISILFIPCGILMYAYFKSCNS
ncbi:hypothetical protein ISS06_02650 [Patescibacteria group bacterium]|nr:hypothetical protein [Patescibacteria group bacterium]